MAFHHGNLREELLDRAEAVLRDRGVEQLSLRELARDAGVSHGAPRSHFIDRGALLDALAERGFDQLGESVRAAITVDADAERLLRSAAGAYLDFATANPALLNLMITAKADSTSGVVHAAAERFFGVTSSLVATAFAARNQSREELERLSLLLSATIQGITSLVSTGRIPAEYGDALLDDGIRVFLAGTIGMAKNPTSA